MITTLTGYQPQIGDIVEQQMYSPQEPDWDATIEERVTNGITYGDPRRMIIREIYPHYDANGYQRSLGFQLPSRIVIRWALQDADPQKRRGVHAGYSWVEDDWCVLTLIDRPAGQLDLFAMEPAQ